MKPNQYHLFISAVTGMLLIILGLILFGCSEEPEPDPIGLRLYCVQDSIIPGKTCYFQASFGDTIIGYERSDYCRSGGLKAQMFNFKTKVYE